jgi:hypothetical protein
VILKSSGVIDDSSTVPVLQRITSGDPQIQQVGRADSDAVACRR